MKLGRVVCFGELLLRLNAPGREPLLQSGQLDVFIGGAEANVAVVLAQLGHSVAMVGCVPQNALGDAALRHLRQFGVDLSYHPSSDGRMGLYFKTTGAVRRPSAVLYDRSQSAFSMLDQGDVSWSEVLHSTDWLHFSGITPATGPGPARLAVEAATYCKEHGVGLSFDGNYRAGLWANWSGNPSETLREILSCATLACINEKDIALILGQQFSSREAAIEAAFCAFPRLERVACTRRLQECVDEMTFSASLYTRYNVVRGKPVELKNVVDRIGTGDAFAAGIIDGLTVGLDDTQTLDQAFALAIQKHSFPGDALRTSREELRRLVSPGSLDVRR